MTPLAIVGMKSRAQTIDILERELHDHGRALEIGVGTGAIALPLAARGVPLVGIDVSTAMMSKLVREGGRSRAAPAAPRRRHAGTDPRRRVRWRVRPPRPAPDRRLARGRGRLAAWSAGAS